MGVDLLVGLRHSHAYAAASAVFGVLYAATAAALLLLQPIQLYLSLPNACHAASIEAFGAVYCTSTM
jgi:hypothetical protein